MREIKFRMWDAISKKYFYDSENVLVCLRQQIMGVYDQFAIDWTFEQFVGIQDKNGKDIFEGDIVSFDGKAGIVKWGGYWEKCGFGIVTNDPISPNDAPETWDLLNREWENSIKIIGNIHESKMIYKED